ncbi:MAG: cation diffusion facilitator family transporter [Planctomycetota bacterium]|jgi:cation diffusion facilitator family transporter
MSEKKKCSKCVSRLSWIGIWDSAFLAIFKGVIGILTGSRALTASALYSLHDVISSVAILIGLKVATRPADKEHPYGFGNAEYIVCVFTSILILAATVFLLGDSIRVIFMNEHTPPHWAVLIAAVISVAANEVIYRFNICAYKQINAPSLLAHAKHHRADVISSIAVVVAVIGSALGYHFLDALVAIFEGGHLLLVSIEILYHGGSGLVDRAIEKNDISMIRYLLSDMTEIKEIKDIKTRKIGRAIWVDLHVSMATDKTIAEANAVSGRIQESIGDKIEHLGNVSVICE